MPVVGRGNTAFKTPDGEISILLSEPLDTAILPFDLAHPVSIVGGDNIFYKVSRDTRNQFERQAAYGVGARVLQLTTTCQRKPTGVKVPVIALLPDQSGKPSQATLVESAFDVVASRDLTSGKVRVHYWVNAWSPPLRYVPPTPPPPPPPPDAPPTFTLNKGELFPGIAPPDFISEWVDPVNTLISQNQARPPANVFTSVRDLPPWPAAGSGINGAPILDLELKAPLRMQEFWVAPVSEAHLHRFGDEALQVFTPAQKSPFDTGDTPDAPIIEGATTANWIDLFPQATTPTNITARNTATALLRREQQRSSQLNEELKLTTAELATLEEYDKCLYRLVGAARCGRVLMSATGSIVALKKREVVDQKPGQSAVPEGEWEDPQPFLVLDPPTPVLMVDQANNRLLAARSKITSSLSDGSSYIAATLNYQYPSAASMTLCQGSPITDFLIHEQHHNQDTYIGIAFAEATEAPTIPTVTASDLSFPGFPVFGVLTATLSSMGSWQSG